LKKPGPVTPAGNFIVENAELASKEKRLLN